MDLSPKEKDTILTVIRYHGLCKGLDCYYCLLSIHMVKTHSVCSLAPNNESRVREAAKRYLEHGGTPEDIVEALI